MRDTTKDSTIERNYIQKWRFLISEYELVKSGNHPQFKYVGDFYKFHGTCSQIFCKYYNRYLQSNHSDIALLPQKRGAKRHTRKPIYFIEKPALGMDCFVTHLCSFLAKTIREGFVRERE